MATSTSVGTDLYPHMLTTGRVHGPRDHWTINRT